MKFSFRHFRILAAGLFLITSQAKAGKASVRIPTNTKLPSVSGKGVVSIGETLKTHDLTVVQFWASWCVGCGPVMADLAKRTNTDSSIGYASISVDEDMETARGYFKSKPTEVREALPNVWLDAGGAKLSSKLDIKSLPLIVITTNDGRVLQSMHGHPKQEDLTAIIAKLRSQLKSENASKQLVSGR